jgi:hypothetical protein
LLFLRGLYTASVWHGALGSSIRGLCITPLPGAINVKGNFAMMERYKEYRISGDALPCPPYTRYWESLGTVLKDGRPSSVVEVVRIQYTGNTFDLAGFAEWHGMEGEADESDARTLKKDLVR